MNKLMSISAATVVAVIVVVGLVFSRGVTADSVGSVELARAKLTAKFPQIKPENINLGPFEGLLEVKQGMMVAYISDDGRFLIQGEVIDLDSETNLTEQTLNTQRRGIMSDVDGSEQIVFSPAVVKHSVTVFTDIDCGFCRKLHSEIDDYMDAGIEIRYMLYPRSGPATPSWEKASNVWCSADRNKAITLAKQDKTFETRSCDVGNTLDRQYAIGQAVGLRGTPAMVTEEGMLISGYVSAQDLSDRLAIEPAKVSSTN